MAITGGCLCGEVRYRAYGEALWVVHCHCRWCQRVSGAAFLTYVGFPTEDLDWTAGAPAIYRSSEGVARGFCARCAGSLDDPDGILPQEHIFTDHKRAWLHLDDGLPRHRRFPPGYEDLEPKGAGERP
jgi:hypothetical protein